MSSSETRDDTINFLKMLVSEASMATCHVCRIATGPLKKAPIGKRLAAKVLDGFALVVTPLISKEATK